MTLIERERVHHQSLHPFEGALDHGLEFPIKSPIVFFDLDLTILSVNSASLWVRQEFRSGRLSLWDLIRATYWLCIYHLGGTSLEPALLSGIKSLRGQSVDDFDRRVAELYESKLVKSIRDGARRAIAHHQQRGHLCCLMTNASAQLSRLIKEELRLDGMICNHFEQVDGVLSGEPAQRLCFGEGKLRLAESIVEGSSIQLSDCYFYTDSYSDLPLLEMVGEPRVVTPDRKLRREANLRAWTILAW